MIWVCVSRRFLCDLQKEKIKSDVRSQIYPVYRFSQSIQTLDTGSVLRKAFSVNVSLATPSLQTDLGKMYSD